MDAMDLVLDAKKVKKMSTTELRWFIGIGEAGLKGAWKGHRLEQKVRDFLKQLKQELKSR